MSKKKRSKSWMVIIAILIIMLGVCLIVYFIFALPFNDGSGVRDADLFSAFGDFIGGFVGSLFSLSGFLLLVETFKAQRETMRIQNQDIDFQHAAMLQERFETTFFNLLQVQQKILDDIQDKFYDLTDNCEVTYINAKSRAVFTCLWRELRLIEDSITADSYEGKYDEGRSKWEMSIEQIQERYQPEYEGDNRAEKEIAKVKRSVRRQLTNLVFRIEQTQWIQAHNRKGKHLFTTLYYFLFRKYQNAIGHYFRHLYHILKYIRQYELKSLDATTDRQQKRRIQEQCKNYAQFVQAQMSSSELAMLYYNSLYYPKMAELVRHFGVLENLSIYDLIRPEHYLKEEGYNLKQQIAVPLFDINSTE
jgi:hypothetical protein